MYSSVAQWQSMRLLTAGLLVRVQPGELKGQYSIRMLTFFCFDKYQSSWTHLA